MSVIKHKYMSKTSTLNARHLKSKAEACIWCGKENFLRIPSEFNQEKSTFFFSDCLKQYKKEAIPLLRKSSQQSYKFRFRYFTRGPLANITMKHLNAKAIQTWLQWLKKHPTAKNKGRKNFIHELKSLSAILNWYRNFVDENFNVPITKKHRQLCHYKPILPKRPDYYARPEELRAWIKWLQGRSSPVYWQLATFMLLTGARVGEACGMLWEAVEFKQGIARVVRKIRWDHKTRRPHLEDTTKTEASVRLLLLSNELIKLLKQMKAKNGDEGLLFKDKKGEPLKYRAIQSAFNAGFMALKLPWRSTHILRHSYATMALIATKDLSSVQASLGHTSSHMTERYAKVIALLDRNIAEKTTKALNLFSGEMRSAKLLSNL